MIKLSKLSALPYKARDIAERIVFTSFDERQRTPLSGDDARDKEDLIEFLNSAMDNQGKHVLQAFTNIALSDNTAAVIDDVYEEGVVIRYGLKQEASQLADNPDTAFISSETNFDKQPKPAVKYMTLGQPLFICDETSMPSVATVLERWNVDSVPIVISITNDQADFAYFDDMALPKTLKDKLNIQYINAKDTDNVANAVIDKIKQQDRKIDCAWGAIGKSDFRPIKNYLREAYGLKGKLNRVRAYWV